MKFVHSTIRNSESGTSATAYLPDWHNRALTRPDDAYADIEVDGLNRVARTRVLKLIEQFAADSIHRGMLGHDAAVFALAYLSNDDFDNTPFNRVGGQKVKVVEAERIRPEDHGEGGEVLLTGSSEADPAVYPKMVNNPNFLVRASVDGENPLYATKSGANGPVGLMTFEQSARLYPVAAVWNIRELRAVPFELEDDHTFL